MIKWIRDCPPKIQPPRQPPGAGRSRQSCATLAGHAWAQRQPTAQRCAAPVFTVAEGTDSAAAGCLPPPRFCSSTLAAPRLLRAPRSHSISSRSSTCTRSPPAVPCPLCRTTGEYTANSMPRLGKQARHLSSARPNAKKPKPTIGSADPALDEAQPMATDESPSQPPRHRLQPARPESVRRPRLARARLPTSASLAAVSVEPAKQEPAKQHDAAPLLATGYSQEPATIQATTKKDML